LRSRCPAIRRTGNSHRARLRAVLIETSSETRHALTAKALLAAHRKTPLKGVLVGSPANPTGTMMSREALTGLMAAAESAGNPIHFRRDLSRARLRVSGVSAAELSPQAVVINSFSNISA